MKRLLVLATGLFVLGGCALPLPVQVASWALDGISYLTTEKSITDHGISVIAQQDCAVLRGVLSEGNFCRDFKQGETVFVDADGHSKSALAALGAEIEASEAEAGQAEAAEKSVAEALAGFETAAGGEEPAAIDLDGAETNARPLFAGDGLDAFGPLEPAPVAEKAPLDPMADYPLVVGPVDGLDPLPAAEPAPKAVAQGPDGPGGPDSDNEAVSGLEPDLAADDFDEPVETEATGGDVAFDTAPAAVEVALENSAMVDGGFGPAQSTVSDSTAADGSQWQALAVHHAGGAGTAEPEAGLYFVIGSFRQHDNARALRSRYRVLTPAVLAADVDGAQVFRVVVGPFQVDDAKDVHQRIFEAGISDSWAIQVRPGEWSMAMVDPPATAPEMAAIDAFGVWNPMRYVRMLGSLIQ